MNSYDLSFGNLALSLLITVMAYIVVPVMLRLIRKEAYNKEQAISRDYKKGNCN